MDLNHDHSNARDDLHMENEFLKLKLTAEHGAVTGGIDNIPPELQNEFLRNIIQFEEAHATARQVTIRQLLGNPKVRMESDLTDVEVTRALKKLIGQLTSKNIVIEFLGNYDDRTRYRFISDEFMKQETDDLVVPGLTTHFLYEEFHPNHRLDIQNRSLEFLNGWFDQNLDKTSWELADDFILPNRRTIKCSRVIETLKEFFECYHRFIDCTYTIENIHFEFNAAVGMGSAQGHVAYTGVLDNAENIVFEGEFKLFLCCEYGWWSICYFIFPGFEVT